MIRHQAINNSQGKRSDQGNIDLLQVRIAMEPDMNNGRIRAGKVDFRFRTTAVLNTLQFDLRKELTVDSVLWHGIKISYIHSSSHLLTVSFPIAVPSAVIDSLSIFYNGMPDMSTRAYFRSVNVSGASVSTLSQPYGAHYWWPCRESLKDKIDSADFVLTVDTPYYAVANGSLKTIVQNGAKRNFYYSHRYPVTNYLLAVSFSRYSVYKDTAKLSSLSSELEIINHVFPHNDNPENRARTAQTKSIMHLFDSLFGPYPFHKEHYGHAQFGWSGGMEHQTMSFMANFNYDLIAHELGHQWFGDKVTCGTWKDIWLNEGFATYTNLLCYDFLKPRSEWINQLKTFKDAILAENDGAVYKSDTSDVNLLFDYRTTYQKGALVLHQLRYLIGDSAFFKALRNYLSDTALAYSYALESDIKAHFEQTSGMNLDDYFSDWIKGEGYPKYDVTWYQNGKNLNIKVTQLTTHASVKEYNVPLPLLFKGNSQEVMLRVPVTDTVFTVTYPLNFKVKSLEIDPDEWLLARFTQHFSLSEDGAMNLYPNPFNQVLYLTAENFEIRSLKVYDLCGRKVEENSYQSGIPKGDILSLDTKNLESGVYIIEIIGENASVLKKIIKQATP